MTGRRITVDTGRCAGLGVCESIAPEIFEVGGDGEMSIRVPLVPADAEALVEDAIYSCPTQSLSWSE
jgi:ferredoxin